jgi:flagellar FliJ protein
VRRFSFQLEKVLELRRYSEQEWELKLGEITSRVIAVENQLAEWAERRHATTGTAIPGGRVDMHTVRSRADYVSLIDDRLRQLQRRLVTLEAERDKVRERYLEASRERKALSKLRERRRDEYYKDAKRHEVYTLDEIANSMRIQERSDSEDENVQ